MFRALVLTLAMLVGCTKPNPNRCCISEADCTAQGLPVDSQCTDGLVCRGGQCIAVTCTISADCELGAPYCTGDDQRLCSDACTADMQCPGFGEDGDKQFCEDGRCVVCREGRADCPGVEICDQGGCRGCVAHSECATGICTGGTCAPESEVAVTAPTGSASSDCTVAEPCNLARALGLSPPRKYIVLAAGTYEAVAYAIDGTQRLVGRGIGETTLRGSGSTSVFTLAAGVDELTVEQVTIDANGTPGLSCEGITQVKPRLRIYDSAVRNATTAIRSVNCELHIDRVILTANGDGVEAEGPTSGLITNSFAFRNTGVAIRLRTIGVSTAGEMPSIAFNTFVDNGTGISCSAGNQPISVSAPNNIIARNGVNTISSGNCGQFGESFPGSMVRNDVGDLMFKSPDMPPYDYHIMSGSIAIDAALGGTLTHDFDGDVRPQGAGRDVGADEAE
jgi:hypothetical protein